MAEKQKTIKQAGATLKGKGLHTGVAVEMTFKPAPENFGYRFKRIDLENQPEIRAIVDNVSDTTRSTTVEEKKQISERFTKVNTLEEGKKLYETISEELRGVNRRNDVNGIINSQLAEGKQAKQSLVETTMYKSEKVNEALDFMKRLNAIK